MVNISMGVRHREKRWKHEVNTLIDRIRPELQQILMDYRVPLLDSDDRLIQPRDTKLAITR